MPKDEIRRDPLASLGGGEPAQELGLVPSVLARRPAQRRRAIRPSEKRRAPRKLLVTFSDEEIPDRLRALAERWHLMAASGKPAVSTLVEYLLYPQLEAAERGEIEPPKMGGAGNVADRPGRAS